MGSLSLRSHASLPRFGAAGVPHARTHESARGFRTGNATRQKGEMGSNFPKIRWRLFCVLWNGHLG
jgi:hypothetical protein